MTNGAAYLMSQVTCAHIEMEGMRWANERAKHNGDTPPFSRTSFLNLIEKYGLESKAALAALGE
jgi:hypothetical protein